MSAQQLELRQALSHGLLSFPITDFSEDGSFNATTYRQRIERFIENGVSAIFVAGGTGEFFSLSKEEYSQIVQVAVDTVDGRLPVIASAGRSIPEAIEFTKIAEDAGCHGILLMPPYLTGCPEEGLVDYASTIMNSSSISFVYYNRANGRLSSPSLEKLAQACPNFISLKDGIGDVASLNDTIKTIGDRLVYIGGVPTAEISAEAYMSIGVNTYSSAVYNFMPEMALKFYNALQSGDQATVDEIIKNFFIPFCRLRDRQKGYAVSLIKAGATLQGQTAGDVRSPLTMPTEKEVEELQAIISSNQEALCFPA